MKRPGNLVAHLESQDKEAYDQYSEKAKAKKISKLSSKTSLSAASATPSTISIASAAPATFQSKLPQFVGGKSIKYYDKDSDRY